MWESEQIFVYCIFGREYILFDQVNGLSSSYLSDRQCIINKLPSKMSKVVRCMFVIWVC